MEVDACLRTWEPALPPRSGDGDLEALGRRPGEASFLLAGGLAPGLRSCLCSRLGAIVTISINAAVGGHVVHVHRPARPLALS